MTGDPVDPKTMAFAHLSDFQMADMVRMLMRSDLMHEPVCVGARDRIMYLSQRNAALSAELEALRADAERWKAVKHRFEVLSLAPEDTHTILSNVHRHWRIPGRHETVDAAVSALAADTARAGEGEG